MRLGVAHHLGWAVAVTASPGHTVADRRRIELVEPGLPAAPVHHVGGPYAVHHPAAPLDDGELASLVASVRAAVVRAATLSLDELASTVGDPIVSISLAGWPADFPDDVAVQRRVPYESRADSVMYRQVLADVAQARDWAVHCYDAKTVEAEAEQVLGAGAHEVLHGPRRALGPPWTKDHRVALAATVVAATTRT
jgi:hypothetical protein